MAKAIEENYGNFFIVGIGTSAGGLQALTSFFKECPADTGLGFVVVQHLSPNYKSLMPELLSRHTNMEVAEALDGELVEKNKIYLIPKNKNITVANGKLILKQRPPTDIMNFAIDIFFTSLAKDKAHLAIGVILSGTGSDGTKGCKSIKEAGGTVIAQSPKSSGFDGMPRSVISNKLADYILDPKDMVPEISQYVKNPQFHYLVSGTDLSHELQSIDRILSIVKDKTHMDFTGYKLPTILRRTAKRINILKCDSIKSYIDILFDDVEEPMALAKEFLINVTRFFRDEEVFSFLAVNIIPELVTNAVKNNELIKAWVIATSTGEEAYSIAMLLEEEIAKTKAQIEYKIYATDIDDDALAKASKGNYTVAELKDVSKRMVKKFFDGKNGKYTIKSGIRKNIIFSKHDAVNSPPMTRMDFISCRNLLIYLDSESKNRLVGSIQYSLKSKGYLMLGKSESASDNDNAFKKIHGKNRIYQNQNTIYLSDTLKHWKIDPGMKRRIVDKKKISTIEEATRASFHENVQTEFRNATVCVDENMIILYAYGKLKRFIKYPDDGFTNNLSKILDDTLLIPIMSAIRKISGDTPIQLTKLIQLKGEVKEVLLKIIVKKLNISNYANRAFVITFLELGSMPARPAKEKDSNFTDEEVKQLRETLNETRENLQLTIEELETSNEEMQATNEELLAANEELQSTNEELQSVNEELHTVNAELQNKNTLLFELNDDFKNLLQNVQIGTLFLDKDLNIRRFTPAVLEHFNLREQDLGRSIIHYAGIVQGSELAELAEKVIKSGIPQQVEKMHHSGTWYWIKISPYIDANNYSNGVTVNFINIDEQKNKTRKVEELYSFLKHLTETVPAVIMVNNPMKMKISYISGMTKQMLGVSHEEMLSKFYDINNLIHEEDKIIVDDHKNRVLESDKNEVISSQFRIVHQVSKKTVWLYVSTKVYKRNPDGTVRKTLVILHNVTSLMAIQSDLQAKEERYRLAIKSSNAGLWECYNTKEGKMWWSDEYLSLVGYDDKDVKSGYQHFLEILHPDSHEFYETALKNADKNGGSFSCLAQLKIKSQDYEWFQLSGIKEDLKEGGSKIICNVNNENQTEIYKKVIESKNKELQNIFDHSPIGYFTLDEGGYVSECSEGFADFLEYDKADLTDKKLTDYLHVDFKDDIKVNLQKLKNFEIPFAKMEKKFLTNEKKEKWGSIHIRPIQYVNEKGNIISNYAAIIADITDKKFIQNQLKNVKSESVLTTKYFSELVNNKLTQINTDLEKITTLAKEKSLPKKVESIQNKIDSTKSDIEEFSIFNTIYNGHPNRGIINLNKIIKKISKDLVKVSPGLSFKFDVLPGVSGDPEQIENLFNKLMKIANELCSEDDKIVDLQSSEKNQMWLFETSFITKDKSKLDQLKRFFKDMKPEGKSSNFYLSLMLCNSIIKNHSGEFWMEDTENKKTHLFFTLKKFI